MPCSHPCICSYGYLPPVEGDFPIWLKFELLRGCSLGIPSLGKCMTPLVCAHALSIGWTHSLEHCFHEKERIFFFKLEWKRNKTFGWQLHTQYNAIYRVDNKWGIFYEMERKTKINLIHGMKFGTCVTECCRASLDYLNYSELKIFNSYCGGCAVFNLKLVGLV